MISPYRGWSARLATGALAALACIAPLSAQSRTTWVIGGGLSVPTGEFDQFARVGAVGTFGAELALRSQPVSFRAEAFLARNSHDDVTDFIDKTTLTGANLSFIYRVSSRVLHFYVIAGAGYLHDQFSTNDPDDNSSGTGGQVALHEGAGLAVGKGSTQVFVEGQYVFGLITGGIRFIPLTVGLRFAGGKK